MIAVDSGHAAMAVTHVFAKADVGDDDKVRGLLLDRADGVLHDALFGIRSAGLLVFFLRDTEKQNRLQTSVLRVSCFIDNFLERQLENAGHRFDGAAFVDLRAHEQRQDKVVRVEIGLTNEVAQSG